MARGCTPVTLSGRRVCLAGGCFPHDICRVDDDKPASCANSSKNNSLLAKRHSISPLASCYVLTKATHAVMLSFYIKLFSL